MARLPLAALVLVLGVSKSSGFALSPSCIGALTSCGPPRGSLSGFHASFWKPPSLPRSAQPALRGERRARQTLSSVSMAGKGFGGKPKLKLRYGGSAEDPTAQQHKWELSYKAFIQSMGKYLTAMSWEGFLQNGRGAIYANHQARPPVKRGESPQGLKGNKGTPTLYIPQQKYQEKSPQTEQERHDLQQILTRVESYDPEREFVVVFEAAGLMGADVVRPGMPPPEVHKRINLKEYGMATSSQEDQDNTKEMADYWLSGEVAKPPSNPDEFVDVSTLIAEASMAEDGVMDISSNIERVVDSNGNPKSILDGKARRSPKRDR